MLNRELCRFVLTRAGRISKRKSESAHMTIYGNSSYHLWEAEAEPFVRLSPLESWDECKGCQTSTCTIGMR